MHRIQQHIIHTLMFNDRLRYARIKPKDVEGNLFMYHLKKLIQEGIVKKDTQKYSLTTKGLHYVEGLSVSTFTERIQPKIVTLIACQNTANEWLLYRRKRQPLSGKIGFPYGKIHLGESIQDAAKRELKEKTGLEATLRHRGDAYVTTYKNQEIVSQLLTHVFEGANPRGEILEDPTIGKCFWKKIDAFSPQDFIPGFIDICRLLKTHPKDRFFAELVYHLK